MKLVKNYLGLCLLFSSVSAMALPGDTVIGGNGTIEFNGTLSAATCEMMVDTTAKTFALNYDDAKQSNGTIVKTMTAPVTFTNCAGQNLKLQLESTKGTHSGGIAKFEEPRSAEGVDFFGLVTKANNFTGLSMKNHNDVDYTGAYGIHVGNGNKFGIDITDDSASMDYVFEIISRGANSSVAAGDVKGGITYTFTYA
ncbi:type 1 fimbrial protein [Salmonella enterica]|uniref:Type 1 fimbrial protein n=1 Tax=Salmonella enterica TaxID=28901 RepID=A0A5T4LQF8_SALER|nr:type 1 fimbrial protein [Salmonella enterica]EBL7518430.1 type 1 fimbrial protein [Salmonella enterica]